MAYGRFRPSGYGRRVGGRRIGAIRRRRPVAAGRYIPRGVRGRVMRAMNPSPTFVETFSPGSVIIPAGAGQVGGVFSTRITDVPQVAQYATLYKQYRINWVKVMLVPDFNTASADQNAAQYNATIPTGNTGLARIVHAVNNSPQLVVPANEAAVLEDNGCKIRTISTKWSATFKPVPDVGVIAGTNNNTIFTKSRYRQYFNFDTQTPLNNPLHYGITYWITMINAGLTVPFHVYYKVSFTLRDPQ